MDRTEQLRKLEARATAAKERLRAENVALAAATKHVGAVAEARALAAQVAATVQRQAHAAISAVVSRCLATVFDDPYEFRVEFVQKRGKTEANLMFYREGQPVDPTTAAGGGVVDVAAFGLRLAALMLARPRPRRLLVLDEPFKFVSAAYRPRVRQLLESLAVDLDVQIIMVTHISELQCGSVVEIS